MINNSIQKNTPKIWKIVLAVSLALNIVVICLIAGATIKNTKNDFRRISELNDLQIGSFYIRALNKDQRRELIRQILNQVNDNKKHPANLKVRKKEVIDVLSSTEFSQEKFEIVFKSHSEESIKRLELVQENFISLINTMSEDERLNYADRIANKQAGNLRDK